MEFNEIRYLTIFKTNQTFTAGVESEQDHVLKVSASKDVNRASCMFWVNCLGLGASKRPIWAEFENFRLGNLTVTVQNTPTLYIHTTHCIYKLLSWNLKYRFLDMINEAGANLVLKVEIQSWLLSVDWSLSIWAEFQILTQNVWRCWPKLGGIWKFSPRERSRVLGWKDGRKRNFHFGRNLKFSPKLVDPNWPNWAERKFFA